MEAPCSPRPPLTGCWSRCRCGKGRDNRAGQHDGQEGRENGEREREREQVPSPPLFIAAIDRGMCALIQVDHLLELDKHVRVWALYCHSEREREREKVRDGGKRGRETARD